MDGKALAQQCAELSRKNAALLEELSLARENASLANENARLAEQNALLKMNRVANATLNPFGMPPVPPIPPRAPPGLSSPLLPFVSFPGMSYPMLLGSSFHGQPRKHANKNCSSSHCSGRSTAPSGASSRRTSFSSTSTISSVGLPTAVRMNHIPDGYSREQLLEIVDAAGFQKDYDVVTLPMDLLTEDVLGYAFINFRTHEEAERFKEHFQGFKDWQMPSDKVCETSWSDTLQGRNEFVERYRNSPMMHESVADKFKPALYQDGVRVPFPAPTKAIKPPRPRQRNRGSAGKAASEITRSCEAKSNTTTDKEDTADVL